MSHGFVYYVRVGGQAYLVRRILVRGSRVRMDLRDLALGWVIGQVEK